MARLGAWPPQRTGQDAPDDDAATAHAQLPPDACWPPLPPPDLTRPPPWLLPPPPDGMPPPPPPPEGWASSWETAVPWPPPPLPHASWAAAADAWHGGAHGADADVAHYDADAYGYEDADQDAPGGADVAHVPAGEVIWRAGDASEDGDVADEEEEDDGAVEITLSEEWAARFALTEHRRAQRKQQARAAAAHRPAFAAEAAPRPGASASMAPGSAPPPGPPLTVVDIVNAAGVGAARPDTERYGVDGAVRVAALEAALQARYERALSSGRVQLWPCEPLRSEA